MRSQPFSYYGGKQRIVPHIIQLVKQIKHTVYVEPFCGGASVFWGKPIIAVSNSDNYREVLNDSNDLIINFYRVAKTNAKELIKKIDATLYSESDYRKSRIICQNPNDFDALDRAWGFYVNINQSFANKLNAGWGRTTIGPNPASTWNSRKNKLFLCCERLATTYISCTDAIKCIKDWDSPQTLFYCDPPYLNTDQGHYDGYSIEDYKLLCETLDSIDGSYILSNYPQEVKPKSVAKTIEIKAAMSASRDKKLKKQRTELLMVCDRSINARKDIQDIYRQNDLLNRQMQLF